MALIIAFSAGIAADRRLLNALFMFPLILDRLALNCAFCLTAAAIFSLRVANAFVSTEKTNALESNPHTRLPKRVTEPDNLLSVLLLLDACFVRLPKAPLATSLI